jgi:hypothetical protein
MDIVTQVGKRLKLHAEFLETALAHPSGKKEKHQRCVMRHWYYTSPSFYRWASMLWLQRRRYSTPLTVNMV